MSGSVAPEPLAPELPVLAVPAEGVPPVVADRKALDATIAALRRGTGPVAVDAERAQGYRYGAEAYLIQLRRSGSGTHLIDPRAFLDADGRVDLGELDEALAGATWILHAASQDLACLADAGLRPRRLFDTELAARLAHFERVGLGPVIEQEFGVRLLKEHSAADWSQRPLPEDWLVYAALDVELLIPLAEKMTAILRASGKLDWAEQEFAALVAGVDAPREERVDPWRRLHGLANVRTQAGLALARELWSERDAIARRLDKGPSRILPDQAIATLAGKVDQANKRWPGRNELRQIDGFNRRNARRFEVNWLTVIERCAEFTKAQWPPRRLPHDGPSRQPKNWENRHPEAYARWLAVRPAVNARAEELDLPAENLLSPAALRAVAWAPAGDDVAQIAAQLQTEGARPWQAELTAPVIVDAIRASETGASEATKADTSAE